ncbi:DUF2147 domain-containing protein [bacterium]|nr:DUF2147 domain-containing protein [bacterium]
MKKLFVFMVAMIMPIIANAAAPHVGFYQTIDDKTNTPKSIVALYEYNDDDDVELAGRIVALYGADGTISETIANPVKVADQVKGKPTYVGLDIIWDMEWDADDNRYEDGKIMDPQSGSVYSSVIWAGEGDMLNVRGKIGPIGRTQKWRVMDAAQLPADIKNIDTSNWTPKIRK